MPWRDIIQSTPFGFAIPRFMGKKIILWVLVGALLFGLTYGLFLAHKLFATSKKINIEVADSPSFLETLRSLAPGHGPSLKGTDADRINILLLGIAGQGKLGQNLTDTIMLASLDLKNNKTALLSLPRDLYVQVPDYNFQTKINSVYQYALNNTSGEKEALQIVAKTIESVTSLPVDYYVVLNFDGFEKIIDAIGGVNIISERDIYDPRYPGPNYSYETFELSKGFHQLDGATALKYARERHNDPEGDFGRAKRQQQILQAVKNKVFSVGTLLNPLKMNELLDELGGNILTDIAPEEVSGFLELAKKIDTQNINNVVVDAWSKDSLLKVSHIALKDIQAFVLVPRVGNYSEIHDLAQNIFDLNRLRQRREAIAKEDARLILVNQSGDRKIIDRIRKLLAENLNYKNITLATLAGKTATEKTVAYDLAGKTKPFTLDELATKLPAAVSENIDPTLEKVFQKNRPDIILVIGKDLIEKYNMEEATLEDLNNERDAQDSLNLSQ